MQHSSSLLFLSALPIFREIVRSQMIKWQLQEEDQFQVLLTKRQIKLQDQMSDLICQAFANLGFTGPIYINFIMGEAEYFNAFCGAFWDNGERAASVDIVLPKNSKLTFNELYAAAGHEAVHAKHEHLLLNDLLVAGTTILLQKLSKKFLREIKPQGFDNPYYQFFSSDLMLGLAAFGVAQLFDKGIIKQILEKDADISSAKKLGTAFDLITLFKKMPGDSNNPLKKIFGSHPSIKTRTNYLARYIPSSATMFQPTQQQVLVQEELCLGNRVKYR